MGSFTSWIKTRLRPQDRGQLLRDLLAEMQEQDVRTALNEVLDAMPMDAVADVMDDQATRLNNASYDWGCMRDGDEVRDEA